MPLQVRLSYVGVAYAPKEDPSGHTFLSSSILFRSSNDWQPLPSRSLREACTRRGGEGGQCDQCVGGKTAVVSADTDPGRTLLMGA